VATNGPSFLAHSLNFLERLQPLGQRRVRVVPLRVEPVVDRVGQVVLAQLHQRRRQIIRHAQLGREPVGGKLAPTAPARHQEVQQLQQVNFD